MQGLYTVEEVSKMIRQGNKLLLAGDDSLLAQLPEGDWIAGTTPYFILYPEQMITSYERIFAYCLPDFVENTKIQRYDSSNISNIYTDAPENGFTVLIIPFGSSVALEYSMNAHNYENFARRPVCGWIAGRPLETLMTGKSYVGSGSPVDLFADGAIAMHITLPEDKYAEIHIFNPFKQGDGDTVTFGYSSQIVKDAFINGKQQNFANYLREKGINLELPLVANYAGAMMNINCFEITGDEVYLSAPVFEQIDYRFAKIDHSLSEPELTGDHIALSVTCITNYLQPELCRKYMKNLNGPVVYGEIAYQLVNQTTMYVTIGDVPKTKAE